MRYHGCLCSLFLFAAIAVQAREPALFENKFDLALSCLSAAACPDASVRLASNINIHKIVPVSFLKGTIGYIALTRIPTGRGFGPDDEYLCELQLRSVKAYSSKMLLFVFTGNTLNIHSNTHISCDAGCGLNYMLSPHLYLYMPASFNGYYPGGIMTTIEPTLVWHAVSAGLRITNLFLQTDLLPHTGASLVFSCRFY